MTMDINKELYTACLKIKDAYMSNCPDIFKQQSVINKNYENYSDINAKKGSKRTFNKKIIKKLKDETLGIVVPQEENKDFVVKKFLTFNKAFGECIKRILDIVVIEHEEIVNNCTLEGNLESNLSNIKTYCEAKNVKFMPIILNYYTNNIMNEDVLRTYVSNKIRDTKPNGKANYIIEDVITQCVTKFLTAFCVSITVRKMMDLRYTPRYEDFITFVMTHCFKNSDTLAALQRLQLSIEQFDVETKRTTQKKVKPVVPEDGTTTDGGDVTEEEAPPAEDQVVPS